MKDSTDASMGIVQYYFTVRFLSYWSVFQKSVGYIRSIKYDPVSSQNGTTLLQVVLSVSKTKIFIDRLFMLF